MADDYEFLKQQVEATDAKNQLGALQGICVYCAEIMQYESMEQKCSEVGNQMRIDHIRQCAQRPELKLIAEVEKLIAERDKLLKVLETRAEREMEMLEGVARENDALREALELAQKVCHERFCDPHPMGQSEVCKVASDALSAAKGE